MNTGRHEESRGRRRRRRGASRPPANLAASESRPGPSVRSDPKRESAQSSSKYDSPHPKEKKSFRNHGNRVQKHKDSLHIPLSPANKQDNQNAKNDDADVSAMNNDNKRRLDALRAEEEAKREKQRIEEEERKLKEERAAKAAELSRKRLELRKLNLSFCANQNGEPPSAPRLSENELRQLDSSLKKCTGFIRKLRGSGITEDTHKSLILELQTLNLSRYISEVVAAVAESKLKSSDTEYAALVCGELHQRFEDFSAQLAAALSSVVLCTYANASKDLAGRRGALRLLLELFVLGMHNDVSTVTALLRELIRSSRDSRDAGHSNLSVISTFVRASSRLLIVPAAREVLNETSSAVNWEDDVASTATKQSITSALEMYYKNDALKLYEDAKGDLRKADAATLRARQTRGVVDEACASRNEEARQLCDRIFASCNVLADALGQEPPSPISKSQDSLSSPTDASKNKPGDSGSAVAGTTTAGSTSKSQDSYADADALIGLDELFESEEERSFYLILPVLGNDKSSSIAVDYGKGNIDTESAVVKGDENLAGEASSLSKTENAIISKTEVEKPDGSPSASTPRGGNSRRRNGDKPPSLDSLLSRLSSTETKESADRFAQLFVSAAESSRNATKRLAKSLVSVSPQKLNVLPAYARIATSLKPIHPEVATNVTDSLKEEFRFLASRTDADEKALASCIKTSRYLGEFVKFQVVDSSEFFALLGICMKDFSGHRVDIACHLLETCGRMIYRTPATSLRMGNVLDTVWRLKSVKNLEARHNTLVETAFFAAKPSASSRLQKRKVRPPLHEYVRRLIYSWLTPDNVKPTILQFKKLPWDDELQLYITKKFIKVSRVRFSTIPQVASVISGVGRFRKELVVSVVDGILEAIRSGMERNDGRDSQKRISEVTLLGELYNARVVDHNVIFHSLYQFITLGHETIVESSASIVGAANERLENLSPPSGVDSASELRFDPSMRRVNGSNVYYQTAPDPPGDFFRVRLVCTLLESCGSLLLRSHYRQVQVFWALFERYIFCKTAQAGLGQRLPLHIDHIVADAFEKMTKPEEGAEVPDKERPKKGSIEVIHRGRNRVKPLDSSEKILLTENSISVKKSLKWPRSETLEMALENVRKIEENPADLALISLPNRSVVVLEPVDNSEPNMVSKPNEISSPGNAPSSEISRRFDGQSSPCMKNVVIKSTNSNLEIDEDAFGTRGSADLSHSTIADDISESIGDDDDLDNSLDSGVESDGYDDDDDQTSNTVDVEFGDIEEDMEDDDVNGGEDDDEHQNGNIEAGHFDEDDDDDDEDDDDELYTEMSQRRPKTGEEEAFEKELAAVTAAAVQAARESPSRLPPLNRMAIPMSLMAQKMASEKAAAAVAASALSTGVDRFDDVSDSRPPIDVKTKRRAVKKENRVDFKFLVRKGGKSQMQDLSIPAASSLAVAARESESVGAAAIAEKKRLVLESSIVVNGDDEDSLDRVVPLRTQQDARAKEQSIKEQRSADEMALLSTLFRSKPRR